MMEDKLKLYLWWKGKLSERKAEGKGPIALPKTTENGDNEVSEALKRKDRERQEGEDRAEAVMVAEDALVLVSSVSGVVVASRDAVR